MSVYAKGVGLCICAPRNQNNSAFWSNFTWSQLFLSEDHWNCIFKLKHTFRILLLVYPVLSFWIDQAVFSFLSILNYVYSSVKFTFLWENFFTSTEVWRSRLEVHFNIKNGKCISFILQILKYEWNTFAIFQITNKVPFFQEVHNYKVNLKYTNTRKVYLIISVRALQILQAPHSTGATKH